MDLTSSVRASSRARGKPFLCCALFTFARILPALFSCSTLRRLSHALPPSCSCTVRVHHLRLTFITTVLVCRTHGRAAVFWHSALNGHCHASHASHGVVCLQTSLSTNCLPASHGGTHLCTPHLLPPPLRRPTAFPLRNTPFGTILYSPMPACMPVTSWNRPLPYEPALIYRTDT